MPTRPHQGAIVMAVLQQKRDLRPANKGEGDTAGLSAPAQSTSAVQNTAPFCSVQYSPCVPEPKMVTCCMKDRDTLCSTLLPTLQKAEPSINIH
ncbi:hypothetical protein VULLAG_LOCUS218 [Vulpes lagopus]